MKIEIEIPKEFEEHFKQDKFKDSLERIMADLKNSLCAGNYEYETIEMLEKALENSESAYDVNKVVEEIKTLKEEALAEYNMGEYNLDNNIGNSISENYRKDMNEGKCFAYDEAIEIVKADGKDEKEKINIMGHNSIEEQKQVAKNTNELLNYLIEIIEKNNKRFSFEWAVGGEHATMEIFDNEKEIDYVVNIKPIKYDETGKAINI